MSEKPIYEELNKRVKELEKENRELKNNTEELTAELKEHRTIFDTIPAMIFFKDDRNTLVRVNRAFADAVGMAKGEVEGKSAFDVAYSRELAEAYWEDDKKVMASGQPVRDIIEPLITDETRWFRTDKIPFFDARGNAAGVIGFSVDITDLKQAEEALKYRSELENFTGELSTRFAKTKLENLEEELNHSLQQIGQFTGADRCYIFQYRVEDDVIVSLSNTHEWCREGIEPQKDNLQELPIDEFYMARDVLSQLQVLNISSIDELPENADKDREELHREGIKTLIAVPMFCGETQYGFIGCDAVRQQKKWSDDMVGMLKIIGEVIANALERKRTEEALKKSERKFRQLLNLTPAGIYELDLGAMRFTNVNDFMINRLGYSREEFLSIMPLEIVHEDYRELAEKRLKKIAAGKKLPETEYKLKAKDGSEYWCLINHEIFLEKGKPAKMLAVAFDITARKAAEKEKEELENQLRQSQKMEALGTLAGGIAHEFNNILAVIMGYTEMSVQELEAGEINPKPLESVINAAERAKHLVNQILTFSRKSDPELKPLFLNGLVKRTAQILSHTIPRMINIELRLSDQVKKINGDANLLEQMLINLGSNARDAMPEGGSLIFETNNTVLDKEYCSQHPDLTPGDYVHIRVSDTGQGMNEEMLRQIFNPFFTTKEVGKGTGLGLSTVFGIVKGHGGHITCESQPGRGTVFDIYLPAANDKETAKKPGSAPGAESIRKEGGGVLLVDDELDILNIGRQLLSKQGYEVFTAANGEEALDIYREKNDKIDIVILDIFMPGMGGTKCLKEILEINPGAKVIIASGYSGIDQMKELLSAGAAGFAFKPFRMADLLKVFQQVLGRE